MASRKARPIRRFDSHSRENAMRTLLALGVAGALTLGAAAGASAQAPYGRPYYFKDEPLMSINRSYLGYSNFVYYGPGLPAHANPPGRTAAPARAPVYVQPPARYAAPTRPIARWYGWGWGYR
jgi:hypothetical protein